MTTDQLEKLLYNDTVYQEVARAVGYQTLPYSVIRPKLQELAKKSSRERVDRAERDLLAVDYKDGTAVAVRLRPALRVRARQLLGPLPEELATWNEGLPASQHRNAPTARIEPPRPIVEEPSPEEQMLRAIPQRMLADRLHFAREQLAFYQPDCEAFKQTAAEVAKLEAEFARRQLVCPVTPVKAKPTRKKAA